MTPTFTRRVPDGDTLARDICDQCGFIAYDNPKIVAGAVVRYGSRILLCKRNIEPGRGRWTLPAGYLENGEAPPEGAMREAFEEASASIVIDSLLAVYTIRRLSQVQLIYRAHLEAPVFAPGPESLAVALFEPHEIPYQDLAFTTVRWALAHADTPGGPFANPDIVDPKGPE
ncbi:NUDIX domain-containing protein [Acuticoccus sp. I52.16.1]|uniref:NUDIX hydrolase n=1 Tax=Acuticoccus sp. I52.16.1 TaxID=2928472 RepID=UPI001FD4E0AB|nr:NUDIX hydrolase [Acuticoccus sp. I52.16.1]UOM33420.1 NUDIX hydrolase [Acuticoccus sp. I52.16.1]